MKCSQILASAALAAVANAHATIFNMAVNDEVLKDGNTQGGYIRFPTANNPIKDIFSESMTCNDQNTPAAQTIDVKAGDKITLNWFHNVNSAADDIIDGSHKGPVMAWIAPTASNGKGDVWVKLAEAGLDGSTWAVDTLIANRGKHSFTIPSVLADGEYLLRGEIIALHESDTAFKDNPARGAQFYMECIQVKVSGGGSTELPTGVAIPGVYTYSDPGVVFNLYGGSKTYSIPGPRPWNAAAGGSAPASSAAPVATPTPTPTKASSVAPVATSTKTPAAPVETPATTPVNTPAPAPTKDSCKSKTTLSTAVKPAATGGVKAVGKWGQCGGNGFTGSSVCASGSTCKVQNPYYSQCL